MQNKDYTLIKLGNEEFPVAIIDDFSEAPETLRETGLNSHYSKGGRHYPGHRAPASASYLKPQNTLLQSIIRDVFGFRNGAAIIECNYSIVTTPPSALTPIQRIPHFDGTMPDNLALLHYLCDEEEGGTSFYRHRSTGFESITQERLKTYDSSLQSEIKKYGMPKSEYFSNSNKMFEKIGHVEAKFNRMVIYNGLHLHSGNINQPQNIGGAPQNARMTLNTFMRAK
ncbi:DUF6445 family protein [Hirschia maritima]|uniref:DUF6445 family protein n=1 Tax=Hirschia maritima TaxID=1121961 RepID=UPI00036ED036|nr:DUF6445 family protein [Hirschia maritima]